MRPHVPRSVIAFTLVELLVVMSVIAILAGILLPTIIIVRRSAKRAGTKHLLSQIEGAASLYNTDWGCYPPDTIPSGGQNYFLYRFFAEPDSSHSGAFAPKIEASSEALFYFLANAYLYKGVASSGRPYLTLEAEVKHSGHVAQEGSGRRYYTGDYNNNGVPEIIDSWERPILYNRPPFGHGSTWDAHAEPRHNSNTFDVFSVGPDGRTSRDLPNPKVNLQQFDQLALDSASGPDDISNWK